MDRDHAKAFFESEIEDMNGFDNAVTCTISQVMYSKQEDLYFLVIENTYEDDVNYIRTQILKYEDMKPSVWMEKQLDLKSSIDLLKQTYPDVISIL